MPKLSERLSFANVVSVLALFVALGGTGLAASQLGKNSVGTKQLKKNAVTTAKIKKEAVTAAKVKKGTLTGKQINASTLGTVPTANQAHTADTANGLAPPENWHEVGAPGEPGFMSEYKNVTGQATAAFFRDHDGIVHLKGSVNGGTGPNVFQLPAGYRPAKIQVIPVSCSPCEAGLGRLYIQPTGTVQSPSNSVSLDGVTFRAES
jgi:hypothetical protein